MTFHDRADELAVLSEAFESPGNAFVVVYGRRRVGKTALLKQFCEDRPHLYYLANQEAEDRQREKFVERIAEGFDDRVPRIDDWSEALSYLGDHLEREEAIVVVDEFPYLVDENDSLPSYLQSFVDERLVETDSMLVLCGSSVSTMESEVLGSESPLYGRRTAQIDLQPFSFATALPVIDYGIEDAIRSFSITGGTPMYLTLFDYERSLAENVSREILDLTAVLYNEPEFLLRTELRNPARYLSIMEAIATGHTTPNEIAGTTGVDTGPLSKYLQTLRRLRLVEREVSVTASRKNSTRSLYRIGDEFLRFWFRYVEPNRSGIESAPDVVYDQRIAPDLPTHVATTFESVCAEAVWAGVREGRLPAYSEVGRWWDGEDEIDIVALAPGDDEILLAECKWTGEPVGRRLADDLRSKAEHVRWGPDDRTESYALFSRSGFEDGFAADLGENWYCFDLGDVERLLAT